MKGAWRILLSEGAKADVRAIVQESTRAFGTAQARRYYGRLFAAIDELREGPSHPLARQRLDLGNGLLSMHATRRSQPTRHIILFHMTGPRAIEILRILHDAMDLPSHLPAGNDD